MLSGCLGEPRVRDDVPCHLPGGGGQGHPVTVLGPAPMVAAPPAPAHVVPVLAPVPLASPDTRRSRAHLPSGWWGAGGEASPCQLPRGRGWSAAGAFAQGCRLHPGRVRRPWGLLLAPLSGGSGCLAQPVNGAGRFSDPFLWPCQCFIGVGWKGTGYPMKQSLCI